MTRDQRDVGAGTRRSWREGELSFDFGKLHAWRLDEPGRPQPIGMKFVDFVVEEQDRLLLVEVKDLDATPECHRPGQEEEWRRRLRSKDWIGHELVPKARDSYTFLHLMALDTKPMDFVVLLGWERCEVPLLVAARDILLRRLRKEAAKPWKREYVLACWILRLEDWEEDARLRGYRVTREGCHSR